MVLSPYICILSSLFLKVKIFANASQAKIVPQKSQKFLSKMLTFTSWGTWFTIIDFPNKVVITLTFIKASFKSEIARWVFKTSRTDYFAFGYDAQVFFNLFFYNRLRRLPFSCHYWCELQIKPTFKREKIYPSGFRFEKFY